MHPPDPLLSMDILVLHSNPQRSPNDDILGDIEKFWCQLLSVSPHSYFLSWGWVRTWLLSLPSDIRLSLVVVLNDNRPCCAFFVGSQFILRHNIIPSRTLFFNSTGYRELDDLCIEFNALLGKPPKDVSFSDILNKLSFTWDEIEIPAMEVTEFKRLAASPGLFTICTEREKPAFYVDLPTTLNHPKGYYGVLSSNTRGQTKKAFRRYKALGDFNLCVADDSSVAVEIFDELVTLHQNSWKARGKRGAFASPFFLQFHQDLIRRRFPTGEIQLMKLTVGRETIACLYNFVYNNRVFYYQSGLNYQGDPRLKPGIVAHVLAVEYNAAIGNNEYHFLAGESQYKKSLSNQFERLVWFRMQKPRMKFRFESVLRSAKTFCHNFSRMYPSTSST